MIRMHFDYAALDELGIGICYKEKRKSLEIYCSWAYMEGLLFGKFAGSRDKSNFERPLKFERTDL
jgi:hypothetical protein